jgi:hypothetical protein
VSRYDNDRVYATYEFDDETSQFDPMGRWQGGTECYERTYRCRVPRKLLERAERTGDFNKLNEWIDDRQGPTGIWLD